MLKTISLHTPAEGFINITAAAAKAAQEFYQETGKQDALCTVYCPHTTAAITINENADPDVQTDLMFALKKTYPDRVEFRHCEGNSTAHLKASCIGSSVQVPMQQNKLLLGTWQGIYFCEFDGPRERHYIIHIQ